MLRRGFRPLWKSFFTPRKLLTTTAVVTYTLFKGRSLLSAASESPQPTLFDKQKFKKQLDSYMTDLETVRVCDSSELQEGKRKIVQVKDVNGRVRQIMVVRVKGKVYAFLASCSHREPLENDYTENSLAQAMFFNDKLFCPHHGCVFDVRSGWVEHGPALYNLPIFIAEEASGVISIQHPLKIPSALQPQSIDYNPQDQRKVLIMGGDDAATIGCCNSMRQFGYDGDITVVKEGNFHYPYREDLMHKCVLNLHLNDLRQGKKKNKDGLCPPLFDSENKTDTFIEKQWRDKVYNKLKYYPDQWYKQNGISLIFNNEPYRIINKQYYPYITFLDGTKVEFDALMIATGTLPEVAKYESITTRQEKSVRINLAPNVFLPHHSREQHLEMTKFINKHVIKSLLVLGYNTDSLEFVQAVKQSFPDIKITVIGTEKQSAIQEQFGPDLEKEIAKEFTSRGIDLIIRVNEDLMFSNKYSFKNIRQREIQEEKNPKKKKADQDYRLKYSDSVRVRVAEDLKLKADGVVIFPSTYNGNTEWVKHGKYTSFDFKINERLCGDTFGRTDNVRIFAAGSGSALEYYLHHNRLSFTSPRVSYEQGYTIGLNLMALRVPFTYIPCDIYNFFEKKLWYVGVNDFYDHVLVIGDMDKWDFMTIYASGSKVKAVSATPSKVKQLMVMREAFRVNCMPMFEDLVTGYWTPENLANLIRKLDKSGCYHELIFNSRDSIHQKDLLWMDRAEDAGFENDRPQPSEERPSQEVGPDGKLRDL